MSEHTPGPWAYTVDEHGDDLKITAGEQIVVGGCGCCGSPFMENSADAPLLAAAPELLEALKEVRDRFFPVDQPERDRDLMWERVNATIAKAEGK